MFKFSVFNGLSDNQPKLHKKWSRFFAMLEDGKVTANKNDVKLYSPAIYLPGATREIANVDYLTFGVADIDKASEAKVDEAVEALQSAQVGVVLHTTHSHFAGLEEDKYKCRLILQFSRPVEPEEWDRVWWWMNEVCGGILDPQCRNANAIYFFPSAPPGHVPILLEYEGKSIDIDGLLEDIKGEYQESSKETTFIAPSPTLLARIEFSTRYDLAKKHIERFPAAVQGNEGDRQTLRAGFIGKDFALTKEEFWPLYKAYNKRCDPPWEEKKLLKKLDNAYKYSQLPEGWRLINQTQKDKVTEKDVLKFVNTLSSDNNQQKAAQGRLIRSMLAGDPIADNDPTGTLNTVGQILARKFTLADPKQLATYFEDCLEKTQNRDVNVDVLAERIKNAHEEIQAKHAEIEKMHAIEEASNIQLVFQRLGIERTAPYTQEEIKKFAQPYETDAAFRQHWIIRIGRSFYFLVNGAYTGPYTADDAHKAAFRDLAPAGLQMLDYSEGTVKPKSLNTLVFEYGSVAKQVVADLKAQETTFDHHTGILTEAPCPMLDIEPRRHRDVEGWLKALCDVRTKSGKQTYERLQAWLACLPRIDRPCAALFLYGKPGVGKTLLGHACSRLWTENGPTEIEDVSGNFNSKLSTCPLVLADEAIPKDTLGVPRTELLRKMISDHSRTYKRKFMPDAVLKGCIRLVIASNTLDILTSDKQSINANDIEAVVLRFLLVSVQDNTAENYLNGLSPKRREAITHGLSVVEHAMWLHENFEFVEGHRFLVEGLRHSDLETQITTSSGLRAEICDWLNQYIIESSRVGSQRRQPIVYPVEGQMELLVNTDILHAHWKVYLDVPQTPKKSYIHKALDGLTAREPIMVNDEQYKVVNLDYIQNWAVNNGTALPRFENGMVQLGLAEDTTKPKKKKKW